MRILQGGEPWLTGERKLVFSPPRWLRPVRVGGGLCDERIFREVELPGGTAGGGASG